MLAARVDQENLAHARQAAGAAKSASQGGKAKSPTKAPPKTPFKVPLNDENTSVAAGKTFLKTNGKGLATLGKKLAEGERSAFVTPAGPRNRAPLGAKTTNAKVNAFKTPGQANEPGTGKTQKTQNPRLRRAELKVHQGDVKKEEPLEGREIEYMPPRGDALPDYPSDDEWGPNKTFPQLAPENLMRGWQEVYFNPVDEDELSLLEKRKAEAEAKERLRDKEMLRMAAEQSLAGLEEACVRDAGILPPKKTATNTNARPALGAPKSRVKSTQPATLIAKSAAAALARPKSGTPTFSAPTAVTKGRARLVTTTLAKDPLTAPAHNTSRHAVAAAASHSTLGYARGRIISQNLRKPGGVISSSVKGPKPAGRGASSSGRKASPGPTTMDIMRLQDLDLGHSDSEDPFSSGGAIQPWEDEDLDGFQLTL
ncbi:hypothetical protein EJ06DRAFT_525963 [Trichodelitschia bisporula]|uniref:Uncharacterized protein n=1 Tax=Trichodelitschia bisporula TaxID=703511 RepID=A0A6G1IAX1_9PEZI|nr:hypothetical protein EJ06DRAFT_525963 [Trichodelitschia bisporula]